MADDEFLDIQTAIVWMYFHNYVYRFACNEQFYGSLQLFRLIHTQHMWSRKTSSKWLSMITINIYGYFVSLSIREFRVKFITTHSKCLLHCVCIGRKLFRHRVLDCKCKTLKLNRACPLSVHQASSVVQWHVAAEAMADYSHVRQHANQSPIKEMSLSFWNEFGIKRSLRLWHTSKCRLCRKQTNPF